MMYIHTQTLTLKHKTWTSAGPLKPKKGGKIIKVRRH